MSKKMKNYIVVMLLGVILNLGLYEIAHVYHLPVWIDSVGTAFAAVALEPAAGLLVAFATNFYQAAVIYDSSSIIYYAVSAVAALTFGLLLRKDGKIRWSRLPMTMISYIFLASFLSTLLTLWRTSGIPDSSWERHFYEIAMSMGLPSFISCFFGVAVLKIGDSIIMAVLIPLLCIIMKPMVVTEHKEVVSWKNPYFEEKIEARKK